MFLLDRLLTAPLGFVLGKVAEVVDAELDDETNLKDELLAAQMSLELGEIDDAELSRREREILAHLRRIREARGEGEGLGSGRRVVGAEVSFDSGDDDR